MSVPSPQRSAGRAPTHGRRTALAAGALACALALVPTLSATAGGTKPAVAVTAPTKPASPAAAAVSRERETLDGVVAASLVGALSEQLGGRAVKVKLGRVEVQTTSLRDRLVSGQGALQIETAPEWIDFRFSTLYDAIQESAGYPELSIGAPGPGGRVVPNDSKLVRELDDRVVGLLGVEFGTQQVRLQLDRIATLEAGPRYLRIDAAGVADFGTDGTAPTRVEALYDREQKAWLRVAYVLQPTDGGEAGGAPATASPAAAAGTP